MTIERTGSRPTDGQGASAPATPGSLVRALILGGREGRRRLDATRSQPPVLLEARDRPVLDWIASALRASGVEDLAYVGGYQLQKVMARYPDLAYKFHARWQEEGEVAAMRTGLTVGGRDHLVLRGDTVLRPEAVERLLAGTGIRAGVRFPDGGGAVFAGSLVIPADRLDAVLAVAGSLVAADPSAGLDALVASLGDIARIDLTNLAAPVGDQAALVGTIFRGKARTLAGIAALTRRAVVLDQVRCTVADWAADPAAVEAAVRAAFPTVPSVVVRSSTVSEDAATTSAAGYFDSVLDVPLSQAGAFAAAVGRVVASYAIDGRDPNPLDEILVQPHVADLAGNGVLFTRDLATGAPYFVLTMDRTSGRSDVVTSGADGELETVYASWSVAGTQGDPDVDRLLDLGRELISLAYLDALDIEFGLAADGTIYLFQVRPLVAAQPAKERSVADEDLLLLVGCAREFVAERTGPRAGVPGRRSLLGNMPDWNPAEMIGAAPRPLALSLYQRLVGDRAWAHARARMGYRDLEPEPLILSVAGRPYVDVRASLASFLPSTLDEGTAAAWIDACLDRIAANPHLHDKIEFEITPTCLAFDWPDHAARMRAAGLDEDAIRRFLDGLREITARVLAGGDGSVVAELGALDRLAARRATALALPPAGAPAMGRALRDHLERCLHHGVEPFAVLARQAFIAMALLRSLVARGAISEADAALVLRSIPTVAAETASAIAAVDGTPESTARFVGRFGHLRSNSYEITAPNYAASLDRVLGSAGARVGEAPEPAATAAMAAGVFAGAAEAIGGLLAEAGLPGDAAGLLAFIRAAIAAREQAKFEFMKDLDLVLETCAGFGDAIGLTRDDLSFLHVDEILLFATDSLTGATTARLRRTAGQQRKQAALTSAIRLPDLIRGPDEVLAFRQGRGRPNFVTSARVVAPAVALDEAVGRPDLDGAIVLIRAADPGYDWIFSHRIAGLVTEYGGMGSHMAIRAAEFNLPAAIGCGAAIYETLAGAPAVDLDCGNGRVRPAPAVP